MLQPVAVGHKKLSDYRHIAGASVIDEVNGRAETLRGLRVLHLSATAFGGGVSEILYSLIPLMRDVGLECEWRIIHGRDELFHATKVMHNALQGAATDLSAEEWATWERYNEINAEALQGEWDVVIVHDPQPAALQELASDRARRWIWRCHIDVCTPNPHTMGRLLSHLQGYDDAVFHLRQFAPAGLPARVHIVPPAIDPLAPKNMALPFQDASYVCEQFGLNTQRPLVTQVSRFDPWKDPIGVIDAYRHAKEDVPDLQLALVGSMASDDPEGWDFFDATIDHANGDPDVFILSNLNHVGAIEVNAFQSHSDVLVQKSTREGFGLTVSEALWKGRPVIAGNVGGIPLQVADGVSGFLVDSVDACALRMIELLRDRGKATAMGMAGKRAVRENFLTPRLLLDWLDIFATESSPAPSTESDADSAPALPQLEASS